MNKYLSISAAIVLILCFLLVVPCVNAADETEVSRVPEYVFIFSVDGLNYEGFVSVPVSNMKHMASEGVIDEKSLALKVDTMEAAQASLLTGSFPEEHKFVTGKDKVEVESIMDVIKKSGKSLMVVDGSGGKLNSFAHSQAEYLKLDSQTSDGEVINAAIKHFSKNRPFFSFIYLNDCLESLLSLDEKAYYSTISEFDKQLGVFIAKLRQEKIYYNSLIIITSPRSSSPSDFVPLVIHGPGCNNNLTTNDTVILDVVPTICKVTGLKTPYSSRGIPIYDALRVSKDDQKYVLNRWVKDLKKDRVATWIKYFELQDELYRSYHQITSIKEEKQSIFDFVGEKEQAIVKLKSRLTIERLVYLSIFLLMLSGYYIEYKMLKKKFLLFR